MASKPTRRELLETAAHTAIIVGTFGPLGQCGPLLWGDRSRDQAGDDVRLQADMGGGGGLSMARPKPVTVHAAVVEPTPLRIGVSLGRPELTVVSPDYRDV